MDSSIGNLVIASFALALFPSLFRSSRATTIAAIVFFVFLAGGLYFVLHDLDSETHGGDGPAFFAITFLYGVLATILIGSCIAKNALQMLFRHLSARTAMYLSRLLYALCLLVLVSVLFAYFTLSVGFPAMFIGLTAVWLVLALWTMPNTSLAPPSRDVHDQS